MYKLTKRHSVLLMLEALGFCRFLFRQYDADIEWGIIIVVENSWQAGEIINAFCENSDAILIKRKKPTEEIFNYQLGLHLYKKTDGEDWTLDFLMEKDFLPVLIFTGIVPEKFYDSGFIFKWELTGKEIYEFGDVYQRMRQKVLEQLDVLLYELKNLSSSHVAKRYCAEKHYRASKMILATGLVWKIVFREDNDEETTEKWLSSYFDSLFGKLQNMDEFTDKSAIQEAVRKCIFEYVQKNEIEVSEVKEISRADKRIFFDESFYFFPECLLKEMCSPLTNTISFLQLKSEMYADKMLECNDVQKKNFTVKVTCLDTASGRYVRRRFLKIKKECLLADSGLSLEEWVELQKDKEVICNGD